MGSQMLPDFLSDGPIIHSSQRMADVAMGLPSKMFDSPDDNPVASTKLAKLASENERLEQELVEAEMLLRWQTRRADQLERQLQQFRMQYNITEEQTQRNNNSNTEKILEDVHIENRLPSSQVEDAPPAEQVLTLQESNRQLLVDFFDFY